MNERIRELALQSDWKSDRLTAVNAEQQDRKLQKFAELIVEEVLGVALYGDEFEQARSNVKQLFGVE